MTTRLTRIIAAGAAASLTAAGLLLPAAPAIADTNPVDPTEPVTVSADALPTVQIDGVVWSQTVVGNTVFVGGDFQNARPAGAAPGTNLTPRRHMLAYDIRTGHLITSFAPSFNAKVTGVAAAPDGSRIYAVGNFTTVNNTTRNRVVALDPATGAVITSFNAGTNYNVKSLVVTQDTVYIGGPFSSANGNSRTGLAAFRTSDGALTGWAPATAGGQVLSMTMTPDRSKVVVGGQFTSLNGDSKWLGLGALDAVTGASVPWAVSALVRNGGPNSAIYSLVADNDAVYGTGYKFGSGGNFEGTFAADPGTGAVRWLEDCHGDTYSVYAGPSHDAVYTAGHAHYCGNIGGFPQTEPWSFYRGLTFSKAVRGTVTKNVVGNYFNFEGQPAPGLLNWYPAFDVGTFTGQSQGPWNVSGNGEYIVYGGEFPRVNGVAQQGLVRFAVPGTAPNKVGAQRRGAAFTPDLTSPAAGTVRVAFPTNWDMDNEVLTYRVIRNGDTANPVFTRTVRSRFWERHTLGFTDTGLTPGSTVSYRLSATDPRGNQVLGDTTSITVASTGTLGQYAATVLAGEPDTYWRLDEASGAAIDGAGVFNGTVGTGITRPVAGALTNDGNTAARMNGTTAATVLHPEFMVSSNTITVETWLRTTTTTGGRIIGMGNLKTGASGQYDRHLYMRNDGRVTFGVYPKAIRTLTSPTPLNNGEWHHVVATLGSDGMALYVDGARVGHDPSVTTGDRIYGYWRMGADNLNGWPAVPTSPGFTGDVDEVALYERALPADEVAAHYAASGRGAAVNIAPKAAFSTATADGIVSVDASASTDVDGTISSYEWSFGDGTSGTGKTAQHEYAQPGDYTITLTVTDDDGATAQATKQVTISPNQSPSAQFGTAVADKQVTFDASASTDPDGSVQSYAWDFGDGEVDTGKTPVHTYAAYGTFPVTLTVADNRGATASITKSVTLVPNQPPTASFTSAVTDLTASFNASASSDADGTIASYAWDFGDGRTGSGVSPTNTYAQAGSYTVRLTVTDDDGGSATTQSEVTVQAPQFLAKDLFQRVLASGWGQADTGGAWTVTGSAANYSVANGVGSMRAASAGATSTAYLDAIKQTNADLRATVTIDKAQTGGGTFLTFMGRRISGADDYRGRIKFLATGEVSVTVARLLGGTETTFAGGKIAGLTHSPGQRLNVRLQVVGTSPTTVRIKVWRASDPEPAAWSFQGTDSSAALQNPGSIGTSVYLSGSATNAPVVVTIDDLTVGAAG